MMPTIAGTPATAGDNQSENIRDRRDACNTGATATYRTPTTALIIRDASYNLGTPANGGKATIAGVPETVGKPANSCGTSNISYDSKAVQ
jgi:hypothetical protein